MGDLMPVRRRLLMGRVVLCPKLWPAWMQMGEGGIMAQRARDGRYGPVQGNHPRGGMLPAIGGGAGDASAAGSGGVGAAPRETGEATPSQHRFDPTKPGQDDTDGLGMTGQRQGALQLALTVGTIPHLIWWMIGETGIRVREVVAWEGPCDG
jgi:hypothetical protein